MCSNNKKSPTQFSDIETRNCLLKKHITIDTLDELNGFLDSKNDNSNYVFRGMSNPKYKILSSSGFCVLNGCTNDFIRDVKKVLNSTIDKFNNDNDEISEYGEKDIESKYSYDIAFLHYLMSKGQHYESKTPFIDFTSNIYTSLFFAFRDLLKNKATTEQYVSIYRFTKSQLNKITRPLQDIENLIEIEEPIRAHLDFIALDRIFTNPDFAYFISGDELLNNPRLNAQDGCFVFRNAVYEEMEDLIEFLSKQCVEIFCIDINVSLLKNVEIVLENQGINETSLKLETLITHNKNCDL